MGELLASRVVVEAGNGVRWEAPHVLQIRSDDVVTLVWGDPPMLVMRRPLRRRWWQLRARWEIGTMALRRVS